MRRMVQSNLIRNSISAYFAAVEIHNKPNISYRYETVTLLMMNAWELALKAYVKKYIKNRSLYTKDGLSISFDKALDYVNEHRNSKQKCSFLAVKENLLCIEEYRNKVTHFYCDELEPYIFMLVARAALNYVEFMKNYFGKNIMDSDGLFIMPLGFKLPFRPEDFLSNSVARYASSHEAQAFVDNVVRVVNDLHAMGIEESIVLGFGVYLESLKKVTNSDLLAAISTDGSGISINRRTKVQFSKDASQIVNMSDEEFKAIWPYTFEDLRAWCKENIKNFKQSRLFYEAKRKAEEKTDNMYERCLDNDNPKSPRKKYYSEMGLLAIKEYYESNDVEVI